MADHPHLNITFNAKSGDLSINGKSVGKVTASLGPEHINCRCVALTEETAWLLYLPRALDENFGDTSCWPALDE